MVSYRVLIAALAWPLVAVAQSAASPSSDDGPPVIKLPLSTVEPDRAVPAEKWNSPYCAIWDDGCTECRRESIDGSQRCDELKPVGGTVCHRHFILCHKDLNRTEFLRICSEFMLSAAQQDVSGTIFLTGQVKFAKWSREANGAWTVTVPRTELRIVGNGIVTESGHRAQLEVINQFIKNKHLEHVADRPEFDSVIECRAVY
jgi:hypothetical protein